MNQIYMLVGVPAAGKTWIMKQLKEKFHTIDHDSSIGKWENHYVETIVKEAPKATKPVLIETPFSMSKILEPLKEKGFQVTPVFISEKPELLMKRYSDRGQTGVYPKGHVTRQMTFLMRAMEGKHFLGTSQEVLEYLTDIASKKT